MGACISCSCNAEHRGQCSTFDSKQKFISWRLFNERHVKSIAFVGKWRLNDAHDVDFDGLRRRGLRLQPDDGVVKGVEWFHVELTGERQQRPGHHVILASTWQHWRTSAHCVTAAAWTRSSTSMPAACPRRRGRGLSGEWWRQLRYVRVPEDLCRHIAVHRPAADRHRQTHWWTDGRINHTGDEDDQEEEKVEEKTTKRANNNDTLWSALHWPAADIIYSILFQYVNHWPAYRKWWPCLFKIKTTNWSLFLFLKGF